MSEQVRCPACDRVVRLNGLGAKDMKGRTVMEWHTDWAALKRMFCPGSGRSAEGVKEYLANSKS